MSTSKLKLPEGWTVETGQWTADELDLSLSQNHAFGECERCGRNGDLCRIVIREDGETMATIKSVWLCDRCKP